MPWSTLCRAVIQSLPRAADHDPVSRELREAMRHLMGLGKKGAIAGRPAQDHWMNSPTFGRYSPLFAYDDCTFVAQFIGTQTAGLSVIRSNEKKRSPRSSPARPKSQIGRSRERLASITKPSGVREPRGRTWGAFPTSRPGPTARAAANRPGH